MDGCRAGFVGRGAPCLRAFCVGERERVEDFALDPELLGGIVRTEAGVRVINANTTQLNTPLASPPSSPPSRLGSLCLYSARAVHWLRPKDVLLTFAQVFKERRVL